MQLEKRNKEARTAKLGRKDTSAQGVDPWAVARLVGLYHGASIHGGSPMSLAKADNLRPPPAGAEWCTKCKLLVLPVGYSHGTGWGTKQDWRCPYCVTRTEPKEADEVKETRR